VWAGKLVDTGKLPASLAADTLYLRLAGVDIASGKRAKRNIVGIVLLALGSVVILVCILTALLKIKGTLNLHSLAIIHFPV